MIYQVEDIKRAVRLCLDENEASTALLVEGDEEALLLERVIGSKIVEGVRIVHTHAPYWLLEQGHNFGDDDEEGEVGIVWGEGAMKGTGYVYLPSDFMRLVVFEMSDWERAVYGVVDIGSVEYAKQRSRFAGLRGTPQRPVCAVGVRAGGRVLEFYSCKSEEATVSRAVYLPFPKIDRDGGVDICERCYEAVVYTIAGLVLAIEGEKERSGALLKVADGLLGLEGVKE